MVVSDDHYLGYCRDLQFSSENGDSHSEMIKAQLGVSGA